MSKEDKDLIDRALDAAEEELAIKAEKEPPAAVEAEEEESDQTADESAQESAPAEKEGAEQSEPEPEVPQEELAIEPPQYWSAEKKALFAKAPKEVQQAVAEYEQQRTQWASRIAGESNEGLAWKKKVDEGFAPFAEKLKEDGIADPIEAAVKLLKWNETFETNPIGGLLELMQANGVALEDLQYAIQSGGAYTPPATQANGYQDPRIEKALAEAAEAKRLAEQQVKWVQERQQQETLSEVTRFKTSTDSEGNPRKAFAEMYAPQISMVAEQLQKQNPGMGLYQSLETAYEQVLAQARSMFGASKPQPQKLVPEKAKAAASSVTGAPSSGGTAKKRKVDSIDEALDLAEEQLGLR